MGNDEKTSVVDKFGRVHGTPNVFVADASIHVTNGGFNPALTIMALGYWVGENIVSEWKKGNRFGS
jgi:choline dehydrogenase-like flavoprotein